MFYLFFFYFLLSTFLNFCMVVIFMGFSFLVNMQLFFLSFTFLNYFFYLFYFKIFVSFYSNLSLDFTYKWKFSILLIKSVLVLYFIFEMVCDLLLVLSFLMFNMLVGNFILFKSGVFPYFFYYFLVNLDLVEFLCGSVFFLLFLFFGKISVVIFCLKIKFCINFFMFFLILTLVFIFFDMNFSLENFMGKSVIYNNILFIFFCGFLPATSMFIYVLFSSYLYFKQFEFLNIGSFFDNCWILSFFLIFFFFSCGGIFSFLFFVKINSLVFVLNYDLMLVVVFMMVGNYFLFFSFFKVSLILSNKEFFKLNFKIMFFLFFLIFIFVFMFSVFSLLLNYFTISC